MKKKLPRIADFSQRREAEVEVNAGARLPSAQARVEENKNVQINNQKNRAAQKFPLERNGPLILGSISVLDLVYVVTFEHGSARKVRNLSFKLASGVAGAQSVAHGIKNHKGICFIYEAWRFTDDRPQLLTLQIFDDKDVVKEIDFCPVSLDLCLKNEEAEVLRKICPLINSELKKRLGENSVLYKVFETHTNIKNQPQNTHSKLVGSIDCMIGDELHGWAYAADAPEEKLEIKLFDGDLLVGSATAELYRPDLEKENISDGRCHFRARVSDEVMDGSPHLLTLTSSAFPKKILAQAQITLPYRKKKFRCELITEHLFHKILMSELATSSEHHKSFFINEFSEANLLRTTGKLAQAREKFSELSELPSIRDIALVKFAELCLELNDFETLQRTMSNKSLERRIPHAAYTIQAEILSNHADLKAAWNWYKRACEQKEKCAFAEHRRMVCEAKLLASNDKTHADPDNTSLIVDLLTHSLALNYDGNVADQLVSLLLAAKGFDCADIPVNSRSALKASVLLDYSVSLLDK